MDYLKTFSTALAAEGKSKNTIKNYSVAVSQLLRAHKDRIGAITQESIDSFFAGFNSRNQTQNFKKNAVNKFLSFLYARGHIKKFYKAKMKNVSVPEPEFLTMDEQERFINTLLSKPQYYRDYVLYSLLILTGERISEALNLKSSDIRADHLVIRDSKTGPGKVYMRKKLIPILAEYVDSLKGKISRNDFIFQSNQKRRLTERMVQLQIKKYLRLAGIQKDLSPHSLRHTFAARLIQSGSDINVVQRTLRHKHIQSTMRYSHIMDDELKNAVERSMTVPKIKKFSRHQK